MGFLKGLISKVKKETISSTNNGSKSYKNNNSNEYKIYRGPIQMNSIQSNGKAEYPNNGVLASRETVDGQTLIDVPAWGYKDFINERVNFQKGLDSMMTSPAWFYFKIFFKFDTKYGLLGGILGSSDGKFAADNTAIQYLHRNVYRDYDHMADRKKSLIKFVKTLSYISSHAPWFFNSIKDVNLGLNMNLENLTAEKSIEIECLEDATDMRLLTMMDLYKYAAYDNISQREILPENLRKFDLDVIVFQSPIKYLHTSSRDLKGRTTVYKNLNATNMSDRMSFKLFSFQGCEFDYASLSTLLPQTFTNDKPFNSKPTIKIKYDRVYQHNQNEFAKLLVGDSGLLWSENGIQSAQLYGKGKFVNNEYKANNTQKSGYSLGDITNQIFQATSGDVDILGAVNKTNPVQIDNQDTRIKMMQYSNDNKYYYNPASQTYKALVDASESTISAAMMLINSKAGFGNLYGESKWNSGLKSVVSGTKEAYKNIWNNGVKNFLQF